jgi:hypothetical protein
MVVQELAGACRTDEKILIKDRNDGREEKSRRVAQLNH